MKLHIDKWSNKDGLLPNLWLGVTAENQKRADERIPVLLQIPAAKRFVSIEPMLGPVDLTGIYGSAGNFLQCDECHDEDAGCPACEGQRGLDWVIIGGLSLPCGKVQPPETKWVTQIARECDEAKVPLFIKPNAHYTVERMEFPA